MLVSIPALRRVFTSWIVVCFVSFGSSTTGHKAGMYPALVVVWLVYLAWVLNGITCPPALHRSRWSAHSCIMRVRSSMYCARLYAALILLVSLWASCRSVVPHPSQGYPYRIFTHAPACTSSTREHILKIPSKWA